MRVLAIRGRNLASLNGDFEVDFEAEPLSDAGIFAITGPTGAGKSTLLDAMCLALFDSVPRLGAAPARAKFETAQGDELSAGDPRAILRHGSGEGFAELDFVGRDGERYRARWTVQRARQKTDGRMQATRHNLTRLADGEILGGTKTETLAEIHRLVGLSAEQFRRAVLLAQGDFEAFIKADDNERAQLLERLTGSHIYASLGRAAHEKATTLRAQQQAILDRIEAQNGLDDEARRIAEERQSEAKAVADRTAATLGELSNAVRWETDRAALANKVAECELAASTASAAREEAAPRHEALRLRKAAFALAGDWTAVQDAAILAQEARQTVVVRQSELEQANDRATQTAAEEKHAAAQLRLETERVAAQSSEIEEARAIDRKLSETSASLDGIADVRAARAQALSRCRQLEQAANTLLAEATETRDAQASWLAANAELATLAAQQQELSAELVEIAAVDIKLSELSESAKEAEASKIEANATWEAAKAAEEGTAAAATWARNILDEAKASAPSDAAFSAIIEKRDRLGGLSPLLVDWKHQEAQVETSRDLLVRLRSNLDDAKAERKDLVVRHSQVSSSLPILRAQLQEARRASELAETASGEAAMQLRATLEDGQACPVCGATEHALSAIDSLLGLQLREQRERIAQLDASLSSKTAEEAVLATGIQATDQSILRLDHEIESQTAALAAASNNAQSAFAILSEKCGSVGLDPAGPDFEATLQSEHAALDKQRASMTEARTAVTITQVADEKARNEWEKCRAASSLAAQTVRDIEQQSSGIAERRSHAKETRDRLARSIDARVGGSADWRQLPDPAAWLDESAKAWRAHSAEHSRLLAAIPGLEKSVADARTETATAAARFDEIESQAKGWEEDQLRQTDTRKSLLDGDTVDIVVARNEAALSQSRRALEVAQVEASKAREQQAAATAHKESADQEAERRIKDHLDRQGRFHARLTELAIEEDVVADAAQAGQEAIDQEVEALANIDKAAEHAAALLIQRQQDLTRHDQTDPPSLSGDALAQAVGEAKRADEAAQKAFQDVQFVLRRDDEVRTQTTKLRADLERERAAARVWLALDELIGDATGARFRRFAQGLTLDRLLAHANSRLADLKPRYELQRAPSGDMLIQVIDHDMAGEIRGVHNLSGGERFLISLALALGLAEMSTGRGLKIESLFIDEGFGALDGASLGQALSVLEHLHATGRRVGVISHVEEIKERIPVKIEVTPVARGRSELSVISG
ncbi:AAA family ATPase [Sphingobium sp. JS3065]|uniref:AAA family ATPase n=1 Tax=Sphingobium sp. JS3065 TaxID=2970925 RepID=UPI0022653BED|nr:AAA family ATPase [Sphingobium sp. JS3065]UZW54841.1 AAA family ATPase [Sphingobium sp. JS3065]